MNMNMTPYAQYLNSTRPPPERTAARLIARMVPEAGLSAKSEEEASSYSIKIVPTKCSLHPGKQLDLFCKVHKEAICSNCTTKHSQCYDQYVSEVRQGLRGPVEEGEEISPFQAIELAAQDLANQVNTDMALEREMKERELRVSATRVAAVREQVGQQLVDFVRDLENDRDRLIEEVTRRCQQHVEALTSAATRKEEALKQQQESLVALADQLTKHQNVATRALKAVDVTKRPVEMVQTCLDLLQVGDRDMATQVTLQPVEKANLNLHLPGLDKLVDVIKTRGVAGCLEVDSNQCLLSGPSKFKVNPKARPCILTLETRGQQGEKMAVSEGLMIAKAHVDGHDIPASVCPVEMGLYEVAFPVTEDMAGGDVEVEVFIGGLAVRNSPMVVSLCKKSGSIFKSSSSKSLSSEERPSSFKLGSRLSFRRNSSASDLTVEDQ